MPGFTEQDQFEQFLTPAVYGRAWKYACRLCRTREDAEDLLQDALIRAYKGYRRLRHPERFAAWLISIVRNCHLARPRHEQNIIRESYWYELMLNESEGNPLFEPIAEALTSLPAVQREVISLFYLDGLTLEETGWVLGAAPQVVGQRLYRARRALRKAIRETRVLGIAPQRCKQ